MYDYETFKQDYTRVISVVSAHCAVCGASPARQWFDRMLCKQCFDAGNALVRPLVPCRGGNCPERDGVCWECAGSDLLNRTIEALKASPKVPPATGPLPDIDTERFEQIGDTTPELPRASPEPPETSPQPASVTDETASRSDTMTVSGKHIIEVAAIIAQGVAMSYWKAPKSSKKEKP